MEELIANSLINVQFRVTARISTLKIDIRNQFNTKIIWKRHQNKTETPIVPSVSGYSTYNESISLIFNMKYDQINGVYLDKTTKFLPAIVTETGLKKGGQVKFNVAALLNKQISSTGKFQLEMHQTLYLEKCPDPHGYIEIAFIYQKLSLLQEVPQSILGGSQFSIDNGSSILKPLDSNFLNQNSPRVNYHKQDSFYAKKSIYGRNAQSKQWKEEKQQLQAKMLMMQQQMKYLRNSLCDKDQQLKHTRAWNQSLIKSSQGQRANISQSELSKLKQQADFLRQKVLKLQKAVVNKALIIGNLLNSAYDIGGRNLVHRISVNMDSDEI